MRVAEEVRSVGVERGGVNGGKGGAVTHLSIPHFMPSLTDSLTSSEALLERVGIGGVYTVFTSPQAQSDGKLP